MLRPSAPASRRSLLRLALAAAVGAALPAAFAGDATAFRDRDCADFDTQRQAQRFFQRKGGPRNDPHGLDADNDGIACESLR